MHGSIDTQVTAPTPQGIAERFGEYSGRTHEVPRPEKPETPGRYFDAADLARRQGQWDASAAEAKRLAAWVAGNKAQREAEAQRVRDAQATEAADRTATQRVDLEATLWRRFLGQPGAGVNDWEAVKEQQIRDHLVREAGAADDAARANQARRTHEAF